MGLNDTYFSSDPSAASNVRLSALYDAVIGSTAQVSSGAATHSGFSAAINAVVSGNKIGVLQGSWTENVVCAKKLTFEGHGNASALTGTFTFASGSSYSWMTGLRISSQLIINSGADGIFVDKCWTPSGATLPLDNGSGNLIFMTQET